MRRSRAHERLQDGIVVVLVFAAMGFAATAPRAAVDDAWGDVTVVEVPRSACAATQFEHRQACLAAAAAIAVRR